MEYICIHIYFMKLTCVAILTKNFKKIFSVYLKINFVPLELNHLRTKIIIIYQNYSNL